MTLDPLAVVRRRLRQQRLVGEPFAGPEQAVAWSGAVQGQEFAEVKWSLAQRTAGYTDAEVEEVLDRGDLLRTHLLRPTWHLVTRTDIRWLLRLTRPRVHALNRYWYRKFELDAALLARGRRVVAAAVGGGPQTRAELARRLRAEGIEADGLRLGYLLMHAELEEVLCSGPRRGKQQTYALLDDRAPTAPTDDRPHDEAVAELALRYFRSHGPATVRDFAAWSSLTVADTRAALDRIGDALEREDHDGTAWYAEPQVAPAAEPAGPTGLLLAMYDETIVAHQDLRVVLAHPGAPGEPVERAVVVDGRAVGTWKRTLTRRSTTVHVALFGPVDPDGSAALAAEVQRFGRFLGLPADLVAEQVGGA
ncbi:winged helix DNA-binding domain-containing protein [Pseudonocardia humida]|uniref:AlkZ family DNA glycosylase n=1 Tax=Pseudonocardia humida TaxID=2800819 RepID=A0ABT1A6I0_9PSEU|nr:winged helix DNA-binding domain-containing protein [Pseudonocardia humida]MCO1658580.1 AlkZ family DNA glycosylase [Pseudonocardia humida]